MTEAGDWSMIRACGQMCPAPAQLECLLSSHNCMQVEQARKATERILAEQQADVDRRKQDMVSTALLRACRCSAQHRAFPCGGAHLQRTKSSLPSDPMTPSLGMEHRWLFSL